MPRLGALVLLTFVLVPTAAYGQVGSTTDILTGVVIGMDDAPLAGAQVEATLIESQITRRQVTDARARYTIVFPDGGGQYQLRRLAPTSPTASPRRCRTPSPSFWG